MTTRVESRTSRPMWAVTGRVLFALLLAVSGAVVLAPQAASAAPAGLPARFVKLERADVLAAAAAADGVSIQAATITLVNRDIEDGCLSANFSHDAYIATCSGVVYHDWLWTDTGQLKNRGTGYCLSANWNHDVYTAGCRTDGFDFHDWDTYALDGDQNWTVWYNHGTDYCMSASYVSRDVYTVGDCTYIAAHYWAII